MTQAATEPGGKRRILVLLAHPSLDRSEANGPMVNAARGLPGVTVVDLYAQYPTLDIDIDDEQRRLLENDVICFQFPLYWYSTPAILKEWQDLVLEHGFAYGAGGDALKNKLFFCAITAGGPADAYRKGGMNQYAIGELLRPLEQTANLCGMVWLPPFALFSSRTAFEEGRSEDHALEWRNLLLSLSDDAVDLESVRQQPLLNNPITALES